MTRLYPDRAYDPAPASSYWRATAPDAAAPARRVTGDMTVGTAVIGGGFTGLNAALRLAERGEDVAVFDAAEPGWGASGRNGGFVCIGGAKLDYGDQIKLHGREETLAYLGRQKAAIDHVDALLDRFQAPVDRHSEGECLLAHSPAAFARNEEGAALERDLGMPIDRIPPEELRQRGMAGPEFHGGHHLKWGFALNPMKYVRALAAAADAAGARLYAGARVTGVTPDGDGHRLALEGAEVRARRLIVAANGYAKDGWIPWLSGRFLPVVSSVMVTRPMSEEELAAQGWTTDQAAYDSRALVHYFRLLPERRFMFGMRGGSSYTERAEARLRHRIRREFERLFPAWSGVETEYFWSGLLSLARNYSQYVGPLGDWPNAWTAFAYHGNGVAMGSYSGRLLADLALGDLAHRDLPAMMRGPAPRFPAPSLRMAYIKAYYALWDMKELIRG